jgi:hypothetical protein
VCVCVYSEDVEDDAWEKLADEDIVLPGDAPKSANDWDDEEEDDEDDKRLAKVPPKPRNQDKQVKHQTKPKKATKVWIVYHSAPLCIAICITYCFDQHDIVAQ